MSTPPFNPQPCDSGEGPAENVTIVNPDPIDVNVTNQLTEPIDVNVLGTVTVAEPVTVDGTVSVNEPVDVNVLGTVPVSGTVTANVSPNPLPVTGTVTATISPNPMPVTGTVIVSPNPLPVTGTVTAGGPAAASTTLAAVTAAGPGSTVDFTTARSNATLFILVTGTVTAGVVDLEGSQDGVNWVRLASSGSLTTGVNQSVASSGGAFRWYRGAVSTAIVGGGSVTATLMYT